MQEFGGNWTEEKLTRLKKYLAAYTQIMSKRNFRYAYIDAFAGTGYRRLKEEQTGNLLFPQLLEQEPRDFLDGSARIALKVSPRFTKYIFVEMDKTRYAELARLNDEFPDKSEDIILKNQDCNEYLQELCGHRNWESNRAVLFLDPFGMQVDWETIKAIAKTEAIDLWILFPLGVAVNRLLRRDGKISEAWKAHLDRLFGTSEWYNEFYQTATVDVSP